MLIGAKHVRYFLREWNPLSNTPANLPYTPLARGTEHQNCIGDINTHSKGTASNHWLNASRDGGGSSEVGNRSNMDDKGGGIHNGRSS